MKVKKYCKYKYLLHNNVLTEKKKKSLNDNKNYLI